MPSYETYAKIFNNTAGHIKLKVSEVDSRDWDGHSRPDMNLNGKTMAPNSELREREEINRFSASNMYRLTIEFSDTESMSARIDQRKAREWLHTYTDYYFAQSTRKYYALKIRRIVDNGKDTLNVKIIQRDILPTTHAKFHAGVYPVLSSENTELAASSIDHTFVLAEDGNEKFEFPCWGGADWGKRSLHDLNGDLELAIAIACFDPYDRRSKYNEFAEKVLFSDTSTFFGDCSGILYGHGGVCHQMANRIMFAIDPGQTSIGPYVYFTPSYKISYLMYGVYGNKSNYTGPWSAYIAECQTRVNIGRNPKGDVRVVTAKDIKAELLRRAESMDVFSREAIKVEIDHEGDENIRAYRMKCLIDNAFPNGYDSEKLRAVTEADTSFISKEIDLFQNIEGEFPAKQDMLDYADRFNRLFADRLTSIHSIVGGEDFKKIFGMEYCADFALIDKRMIEATEC